MQARDYFLFFSYCDGIGPARMQKLLAYFGDAQNAYEAPIEELIASGIGKSFVQRINTFRNEFDLEKELAVFERKEIGFITWDDEDYPELLKESPASPFVLYYKGNRKLFSEKNCIAIVGTRKITDYGTAVTKKLSGELVARGCVIVSGMALGVDAVSHLEAIALHGKTIAVLGSGVDVPTPVENIYVYNSILSHGGLIVSEYRPGVPPNSGTFPARNAIIAGLSQGILVTEAGEESGALITVSDALAMGRPVFAVPGPITSSLSKGVNQLLQKGAKLVTSGSDVLSVILIPQVAHDSEGSSRTKEDSSPALRLFQNDNLTNDEKEIVELLLENSLQFDTIVRTIGKPASQIGTTLSLMEIKGIVRNSGGTYTVA